jgi:hypothetical protein
MTSNWTVKSRGRKVANKRGRPTKSELIEGKALKEPVGKSKPKSKSRSKTNMIVMKLCDDGEPVVINGIANEPKEPNKSKPKSKTNGPKRKREVKKKIKEIEEPVKQPVVKEVKQIILYKQFKVERTSKTRKLKKIQSTILKTMTVVKSISASIK